MQLLLICSSSEDKRFFSHMLRHIGVPAASSNGVSAETKALLHERPYDLILIVAAQTAEALQQLSAVRAFTAIPAIVLVESPTINEQCELLDAGADLVLLQPVSPRILSRYVRILLRRTEAAASSQPVLVQADNVVLDPGNHTVTVNGGEPQTLTQLEFRLLHILMTHPDQVIPLDEIVERVWGYEGEGNRDLVRGLVSRLRRKLEPETEEYRYIHNLPGVGYRFGDEA